MSPRYRIAGINFDHFHMDDLLRMVHEHPDAELVGISDEQPERMSDAVQKFGIHLDHVFTVDDLCRGDNVFVAVTGITDGELLRGVRYTGGYARTTSLMMRSVSGGVRWMEAKHDLKRLREIAGPRYEGVKYRQTHR